MMYCDARMGGMPQWYAAPSKDKDMRVADLVLKCVVFLGLQKDGANDFRPIGTGFMVGVPSEESNLFSGYLITAKHVALQLSSDSGALRVNKAQGGTDIISLKHTKWWYHPTDDFADVAVTPMVFYSQIHSVKFMPTQMFLSDDSIQKDTIGIGDEVYIVGLFHFHSGSAQNTPILRMGSVAMLPQDRIWTQIYEDDSKNDVGGESEAYLIEARSIGGLSGSPVFVRPSTKSGLIQDNDFDIPIQFAVSLDKFYLMGLMHGHWTLDPRDRNRFYEKNKDSPEKINMGIAQVVPAKKILEVLCQPELIKTRKDEENAMLLLQPQ